MKIISISLMSLMLVAASSWFYGLRPGQELYYHWRGTYTEAWRGVRYMSNYGGTCNVNYIDWNGSVLSSDFMPPGQISMEFAYKPRVECYDDLSIIFVSSNTGDKWFMGWGRNRITIPWLYRSVAPYVPDPTPYP